MKYKDFIDSLEQETCSETWDPCLQALWYDAKGNWHHAHEIVQRINTTMASRIHAYLHREEGDDWNSRYWHRRAGSEFPGNMTLEQERDELVRMLTITDD